MERRAPPPTEEGWFALHDFRTVDRDAWRAADEGTREAAVEEGEAFLAAAEAVEDADAGASTTYAVVGHTADLAIVHLRPTLEAVEALERRLDDSALGRFAEQVDSFVSVTEVSGYTTPEAFEEGGIDAIEDAGLRNYMQTRLRPSIPDADYLCFYPMDKRRGPEDNWYDLPFDERAEHMRAHGEIGREYAGRVTQIITGSIGLDDWEWGVTLFSNDATEFKRLLYEMRFDPSTSRFAEFGPFYTGRRLEPATLGGYLAGEPLGEAADPAPADAGDDEAEDAPDAGIREELAEQGVYAGQPHGEDVHALVLFAETDAEALLEEVAGLRGNFDHYDTHERTAVYDAVEGDATAVVSLWSTRSAAETAAGYLADLPGVIGRADELDAGWGTMGMFYTVKPDHREAFVDTFGAVGEQLAGMDGHRETQLLANLEDDRDFFISSRWEGREAALEFFRGDAFRDTVEWGREVLDGRPRHVFLA
ncbi:MAG: heme-binding protein [Halobacteriales archaeon]|nr:heme-binding protein [Halobacteriales archaeon]